MDFSLLRRIVLVGVLSVFALVLSAIVKKDGQHMQDDSQLLADHIIPIAHAEDPGCVVGCSGSGCDGCSSAGACGSGCGSGSGGTGAGSI